MVTADVAYEDGHESYKNIKIGSRPVNKSMEDIGGTRSTGEFSSVLEDLLSPVHRRDLPQNRHGYDSRPVHVGL